VRNRELFDAPHVAFMCIDDQFGTQTVADVGMYAQTLMLAMTANGVASCAQGSLRYYPDVVREVLGLPNKIKVLVGISFGFEDPDVRANAARTDRATVAETVPFLN
jgi:nitroreductase